MSINEHTVTFSLTWTFNGLSDEPEDETFLQELDDRLFDRDITGQDFRIEKVENCNPQGSRGWL